MKCSPERKERGREGRRVRAIIRAREGRSDGIIGGERLLLL
jgi:hypothetical protein